MQPFHASDKHHAMQAAYGFGLFPMPGYRPARIGEWSIASHLPSVAPSYLSRAVLEARNVLTRGKEVWMCDGLLEQESHAWHVHCARGIVVTAGLGMGMYVYAAAMKEEVELVIAADISPDIIALMQHSTGFADWPCRDKVRFVETDVLAPDFAAKVAAITPRRIDYLYADIWPDFPAAQAPSQTADMARALSPKAAGWWGQELSFAQYCRRAGCAADEDGLRAFFRETGLPAPDFTPGYAAFCRDAMTANGMGERKPFWQRLGRMFRRQ
ncbi:hypothetical protein [Telmatospirillum sp. J64-1]|uniref:hypothetical protein n=1 Tax=Telmatospirillum sp. J64-1 TaxID=2502183 RepID=UPI00115D5B25|nr:hypothetical protein [Telmatospirillum sp. J64-1]